MDAADRRPYISTRRISAPIEVWGYVRVQGSWYGARKEIVLKAGEPATLKFDEAGAFGY